MKNAWIPATLLFFLSVGAGTIRQFAPHGISWTGKWPTSSTSAEDAYRMMAHPGDPPFMALADVITTQEMKTAIFLDARSKDEFAKGRIPGARNLPYYEIEAFQEKALQGVKADTPVVIYCEGVGCELSFFLARELKQSGYTNMRIFYGGYPEWSQAGLRIEK